MAISKYSKRIVTYLYGEARKDFELERTRADEKPAPFARHLIKLGIEKLKENRAAAAKKIGTGISPRFD